MTAPKVSVVVPVYNAEKFLPACLASLRAQSLSDIEVLLVNDGSTDGSGEILRAAAEADPRFHLIEQENLGEAEARRTGLRRARGEYVGFVDADDYADPAMFQRMYGAASAAQADLVMCGFWEIAGGKRTPRRAADSPLVIEGSPLEAYLRCVASFPSLWNKLYSRRLTDRAGDPLPLKIGADMALCMDMAPYVDRAVVLPDPLYHYIVYGDSALHRPRRLDGEPNPLDHFLENIAEDPRYDTPGSAWKHLLAAQNFISMFYTNYSYGQGPRFFYGQIKKLRGWPLFGAFCREAVSGRCLDPISQAGGLSALLSAALRVVFLLCRLRLDGLAALLLTALRRLLERILAARLRSAQDSQHT